MNWIEKTVECLSERPVCGYYENQSAATEPTALSTLALAGHGRVNDALRAAAWLAELQTNDGSVGVSAREPTPGWPTSLAVLAWASVANMEEAMPNATRFHRHIQRAVAWILSFHGTAETTINDAVGHDTTLVAWPWVEGTHSWVEPTALHLLALKATEHGNHPRARQAVRLLIDRLLPAGGCNYGNTYVLGQILRPHVQPTGLAMLSLAQEKDSSGRIARSLDYLVSSLSARTTSSSLSWALIGLAAHGRMPPQADQLLRSSADKTVQRDKSPYKMALLALAALGNRSPLIELPHGRLAT